MLLFAIRMVRRAYVYMLLTVIRMVRRAYVYALVCYKNV